MKYFVCCAAAVLFAFPLAAQVGASGDAAVQEAKSAVARNPGSAQAHSALADAYARNREWEQAEEEFRKAIALRPADVNLRLSLAQLQVTRGKYPEAIRTAEAVVALDDSNLHARLIQVAAWMGEKRYAEARGVLDALLKEHPDSADVRYQSGTLYLAEKDFAQAEESFRRAWVLNPANSRGLMGIVETLMAQNKTDDALKLLQTEIDKGPKRMDLLLALGNTAVRAGRYSQAIETFQLAAAGVEPGSRQQGDIYLRIGEACRRQGDVDCALDALQKAVDIRPDDVVANSTRALVLDNAGRFVEARKAYEATLRLDPNNGIALNNLAFLLTENGGDLDEALVKAQRAKQLLPNLSEISDTMASIYLRKNLPDEAIEILKGLVAREPNHATYHFHLGMAYLQKGDKVTGLAELREALKHEPQKDEKDKIQKLIEPLE